MEVRGEAKSILRLLDFNDVAVSDEDRAKISEGARARFAGFLHARQVAVSLADVERIQDCTDADQLEEWIRRTVAGCFAEEIFR